MFSGLYASIGDSPSGSFRGKLERAALALEQGLIECERLVEAVEAELTALLAMVDRLRDGPLGPSVEAAAEPYYQALEATLERLNEGPLVEDPDWGRILELAAESDRRMQELENSHPEAGETWA